MRTALTKHHETLIKSLYSRHGRKKHGAFICEGVNCCRELVARVPELIEFAVCVEGFDAFSLPFEHAVVSGDKMKTLSGTVTPQGIVIVARRPNDTSECIYQWSDPFVFVLDRISDPGNFGTIIRTAKAAGLHEIWYTAGSVDPYSDKVVRSAMGALFSIQLRAFRDLSEVEVALKKSGCSKIYRTDVTKGGSCFTEQTLFDKSAIVVGNEASGAGDIDGADLLHIPMCGDCESLNVAQASAIILFEHVRRQALATTS